MRPVRKRICAAKGEHGSPPRARPRRREVPRVGNGEPRDGGGERARHRIDDEGRGRPKRSASSPPGQRADADGEEEDALIDRHDAAAPRRRGDVGEDDLSGVTTSAAPAPATKRAPTKAA